MNETVTSQWASGDAYEAFMGRWSRLVAGRFLAWLAPESGKHWLDVGSGAGALSAAVLASAEPASLVGIDSSQPFVDYARAQLTNGVVRFETADAQSIPLESGSIDYAVSGLCLNFVPEPERAAAEMARVTRSGGTVAVYVWEYAGGMQMLGNFWQAARRVDPSLTVDEAHRNPLCHPDALRVLFQGVGLRDVETTALQVDTVFTDFDDYWIPFQAGTGPAPAYLKTLSPDQRTALESDLRTTLPTAPDGTIPLTARAWAVRGTRT